MPAIKLGPYVVGQNQPVLVIAEAGVNHNGDLAKAHQLIDAAAETGAHVVKFQSFVTEEIVTAEAPKAPYQEKAADQQESQFAMLKALELSPAAQAELKAHCEYRGILFLSTPYDMRSIDVLDAMSVAAFKIASTDTTNLPLLDYVARKGRPVILSTGMCDLSEVREAVTTMRQAGLSDIVLLHCTSEYPAPVEDVNLRAIRTLGDCFDCPVGFSDHTQGIQVAPWAVAAGACVLEKHFTLDRNLPGPDHRASLEPGEMAELIRRVHEVELGLGDGEKKAARSELPNREVMRKSLVARRTIAAGEVIESGALTCKRPATGLAPKLLTKVVGRRSTRLIQRDEILTEDSVQWE